MAGFETSVFRDGIWVTTTASTQEALDATARIEEEKALRVRGQPPQCGLFTRTLVPSPVCHWILPARIRSRSRVDLALIGSHAVQISELRNDGQLINVARKDDFGSRICNAVVMGETPNTPEDIGSENVDIKLEDALRSPGVRPHSEPASSQPRVLPPQILVLFLENGLLLFIFLARCPESTWKFEMMHYQTPWAIRNLSFRLAVDPTSRYLAAASSQRAFMLWELESRVNLEAQYEKHGFIKPLKRGENGGTIRSFQGTLFHLDFLFPRREDVDHIILVMVVARRDGHDGEVASRLVIFDWIAGEDLSTAIEGDSAGIRLPDLHALPLMIIPLRFKNAMCIVSERSVGLVKNATSGVIACEDLVFERLDPTRFHYANSQPIWSAWTRPIRGDWYCKNVDVVMLAREDGFMVHVEVDADNLVPFVTSAGCLGTNIGSGFAMPYIEDADAIIVSGDSSPGGTWKLWPRSEPVQTSVLRNWSPAADIIAAPFAVPAAPGRTASAASKPFADTEVLISTSGRGATGNLSSFRWGKQARIGSDIDTNTTIRQIRAFIPPRGNSQLLHVALSLPETTMVLQFSSDLTEVKLLEEDETKLDLGNYTISLYSSPEQLVQVTETNIVVMQESTSYHQSLREHGINRAEHAVCTQNNVVVSRLSSNGSTVHVFGIGCQSMEPHGCWDVPGEVTCMELTPTLPDSPQHIVVSTLVEGYPWLSFFKMSGQLISSQAITPNEPPSTQHAESADNALYEGFKSLRILCMNEDTMTVMAGTIWGRILTINVSLETGTMVTVHTRKIGRSAVHLFAPTSDEVGQDLVVTCDDHLIWLAEYDKATQLHKSDEMIIPMSDKDDASPVPPVQWVAPAPKALQMGADLKPILLLAGTRVLIADLSANASLVPRTIPLDETPTRVIYSHLWNCYIVALDQRGRPTIRFVDPTTGRTVSQPTKNAHEPTEYASGLGVEGDRVLCMGEWMYKKDGKTFPFLLVGLQSGSLLTISARCVDVEDEELGMMRQIQYWTRHKRRGNPLEPVYAVLGLSDGILHCTGNIIFHDAPETQEKRLRELSRFPLDSPALSLEVREEKLFALSSQHSLLILDFRKPWRNDDHWMMTLLNADRFTRGAIHMTPMNVSSSGRPDTTVTMLSDASCNVVGLWTGTTKKDQPLETVFRAVLPGPIRRFVKGRCRPPWSEPRQQGKFGTVSPGDDGRETFGVALDGALYHFIILRDELWVLLRFIQSHAERMPEVAPVSCVRDEGRLRDEEHRRHIDGDFLVRCSRSKMLEKIITGEEARTQMYSLLDRIENGMHTNGFREEMDPAEHYFDLVYRILEYLDEPVL